MTETLHLYRELFEAINQTFDAKILVKEDLVNKEIFCATPLKNCPIIPFLHPLPSRVSLELGCNWQNAPYQ